MKSEQGFTHLVLIALMVLIVGVVGFYVFNNTRSSKTQSPTVPTQAKKISHPGIIQSEVFASSLDTSGAAVQPTNAFPSATPKIYVTVGLKGAKTTQKFEYTRYLNDKFVDNGSIVVTKDSAKYASFAFVAKPGKTHVKGIYLVKTYTNGVFERSAIYTVQ